ncbi:hypothetical protein [Nitrosomonas communis]|uniref:hypothetical protein n=1 Tax=Nitrosomonas communis TaxID=44574 RepID=UPI0026F1179C|nr:hypothetical protein [Nitrosomonas communis]MCO6427136.1 hypothetical protein [Nitrosomonas communis]
MSYDVTQLSALVEILVRLEPGENRPGMLSAAEYLATLPYRATGHSFSLNHALTHDEQSQPNGTTLPRPPTVRSRRRLII